MRTLDPLIQQLRESLSEMGLRAEAILGKSVRALLDGDLALASEVPRDDLELDRLDLEIDATVLRVLALQAPVAVDLRRVIATKMIANELERVGDLARNVAASAERLSACGAVPLRRALEEMAREAGDMLHRSLGAFAAEDPDEARAVLAADDEIDRIQAELVGLTQQEISRSDQAAACVEVILVAMHLERVADHATNVAEDAILVAEARNVKHFEKLAAASA